VHIRNFALSLMYFIEEIDSALSCVIHLLKNLRAQPNKPFPIGRFVL